MMKFAAAVLIASSIAIFISVERCRRNPARCKYGFMTEQGWTRSIFAVRYLGRVEEAHKAIIQDPKLRQRFIVEQYIVALLFFLLGLSGLLI